MKKTNISQNWMSVVGFVGERKNGFVCLNGEDTVLTDYIEVRIDADKGSPLYPLIDYTKEDWLKDYPDAKPFIDKNGKENGDMISKKREWTMKETIDRIIAYVHFNHDNHAFNTVFFEVGSVFDRTDCDAKSLLTDDEFKEIISFAEERMRADFLKTDEFSQWMYGEEAEDYNLVDVEENTKRKW